MIARAAIVGVVAAEALTIYVFAAWVGVAFSDGDHAVGGATLVAVSLAAFGLPRLLGNFEAGPRARFAAAAVVTWALVYGALRLEFAGDLALWEYGWVAGFLRSPTRTMESGPDVIVGAVVIFGAWVWALTRSDADIDLETVPRTLGRAFAAVTLAAVLASPGPAAGEVARAAGAFYAVAVLALALSQSARSGATIGTLRAGGVTAVLLAGTTAVVFVGIVAFGLLWGPLAPPVGRVLGAVLEAVLIVVLSPPLWVMEQVARLIVGGELDLGNPRDLAQDAADGAPQGKDGVGPLERVGIYGARVAFLLLLVALAAVLVAVFTRVRRRTAEAVAPAVKSSAGTGILGDVRSLLGRLGRRPQGAPTGHDQAVRLYLSLLDEASRRGHPRNPGITAEEFAPELAATFRSDVTGEITSAFEQARYAGRRLDDAAVRDLERRWRASAQ